MDKEKFSDLVQQKEDNFSKLSDVKNVSELIDVIVKDKEIVQKIFDHKDTVITKFDNIDEVLDFL